MSYNSDKVKEIIAGEVGCETDEITEGMTMKSLAFDELDIFNLEYELEDEFGITLPDDESEGFITVGDVIKSIDRLANTEEV